MATGTARRDADPVAVGRARPASGGTADDAARLASSGTRSLRSFTGAGYAKGRPWPVQAAWFAVMNLVFVKWWFPARWRPAVLRAFGAQIGDRVLIRHRVRVLWPWKLTIGDDCWIGEGAWLLDLEPITLEHDVCLSQEALLCTGSHDHRSASFPFDNAPIRVGAGAWIAARATVLRGCDLAEGEVVAAGAIRSAAGLRRPASTGRSGGGSSGDALQPEGPGSVRG